ncbi:MAG: HAD family hydrolase [Tepidiformaceae bacterium]
MPRILLFDIDMTLIRTGGAGRKAIDAVFAEAFGVENPTAGMSFDGRTDHAIFMETIARLGAEVEPSAVYSRMAAAYVERLAATIGASDGHVLPGVTELLDRLAAERTAAVGLATGNLRRGAAIKLGRFGLWERFAGGGFGDETPVRAEVVTQAMVDVAGTAGVAAEPRATVVIGDTPLDVEAARTAGMLCLGVATGRFSVDELLAAGADWAVPDLGETERVLKVLLG